MEQLYTTIITRPYVFVFFAAFLFLAVWRWKWRKALLWLVSGYLIAWISEYSSIHNGFPYGLYHYVYESMPGELMVGGVPFFDSLSYPFLTFAGFMTACYLYKRCGALDNAPPTLRRGIVRSQSTPLVHLVTLVALGAFLTMMLDVIVDPVATMGEKWFLGKIHYYAYPGWYFGVPLTNFGGWFLVSLAIIGFNVTAWHAFPRRLEKMKMQDVRWSLEPLFYCSIALFQTTMAFWIGALWLGMVNSLIVVILIIALMYRSSRSTKKTVP